MKIRIKDNHIRFRIQENELSERFYFSRLTNGRLSTNW